MKRDHGVCGLVVRMVAMVLGVFSSVAGGEELFVGPGETYTDLSSAITAAQESDTITVRDGTYTGSANRQLNFGGKTLTLRSENGADACVIDCENATNSTAFDFFNSGESAAAVVEGFTITNASNTGIKIDGYNTSPTIRQCVVTGCSSSGMGGGIACNDTSAVISECTITGNSTSMDGGGIWIALGSPTIEHCVIDGNTASGNGGGLQCESYSNAVITNCLIINNEAISGEGGGVYVGEGCSPTITNGTIADNTTVTDGAGIHCYSSYGTTAPTITDTIIANNNGYGVYEEGSGSDPVMSYCHFYGQSSADYYDDTWEQNGAANINANVVGASNIIDGDPLFVAGPWSAYYLSQIFTGGQSQWSPCANGGSDLAVNLGMNTRTTRTDAVGDMNTVDIGYHHPTDPPVVSYHLDASVSAGNGSVLPESGDYDADTVVDLTAYPGVGYRVTQWSGTDNDALKTNTNQVTMDGNKVVMVAFEVIPDTLYVDDDGPGAPAEDGSPAYPYDTIQEAVDAVPAVGTVIVLDGVYKGSGNKEIDFGGKDVVVQSANGPAACVIDLEYGGRAFFLENGETAASVIEGITIKDGYAAEGAAVFLSDASVTLRGCIVVNCQATLSMSGGGGLCCYQGSPVIDNCVFMDNEAYHFGGAVLLRLMSEAVITGSTFIDNRTSNAGGALYVKQSSVAVRHCRFTANTSANIGGGLYFTEAMPSSVRNCTVNANRAGPGGSGAGLYCYMASPIISDTIFSGNDPDGVYEGSSDSDPNTSHCLFDGNVGGDFRDSDTATTYTGASDINTNVTNAWDNVDGDPLFADAGSWDLNGTAGDFTDDTWTDGDYHVASQSGRWDPDSVAWVMDAATSMAVDGGSPGGDYSGELWPHGKRVNIGRYGGTAQASMSDTAVGTAGDFNNDDAVDAYDLVRLAEQWLNDDAMLDKADIERNGHVDMNDFARFGQDW